MQYRGSICGVVEERFTYKLPVSVGCPYNACAFCNLYKHLSYCELPMDQIEAELARVQKAGGAPDRIMLGDGNPFWMPFDRLKQIIEMMEYYLPGFSTICSDASIPAIEDKTDAELAWLANHGYRMAYVGVESGLDDVLATMTKDHDNGQTRTQIARLRKAGIDFGAHVMTGVAGAGRGMENARATAQLLNELHPAHICDFTMFVSPVTQLGLMEEDGLFAQAGMVELLQEMREFVSLLDVSDKGPYLEGYYATYLRKPAGKGAGPTSQVVTNQAGEFVKKMLLQKGDLREDRDRILRALDDAIEATSKFECAQEALAQPRDAADSPKAPAA